MMTAANQDQDDGSVQNNFVRFLTRTSRLQAAMNILLTTHRLDVYRQENHVGDPRRRQDLTSSVR